MSPASSRCSQCRTKEPGKRPPSPGSRQNPSQDWSAQLQVNFDSLLQNPEPQEGYQASVIPTLTFGETESQVPSLQNREQPIPDLDVQVTSSYFASIFSTQGIILLTWPHGATVYRLPASSMTPTCYLSWPLHRSSRPPLLPNNDDPAPLGLSLLPVTPS